MIAAVFPVSLRRVCLLMMAIRAVQNISLQKDVVFIFDSINSVTLASLWSHDLTQLNTDPTILMLSK